jgi:DNA-binding response OmpR family regulator
MSKRLIFAVDDEPRITRLVQVNLERAGYDVAIACNGMEAMEALKSRKIQPDLLLLDVTMPYMDGFEMLAELKTDPELARIPVIMLTARSRDEDILLAQDRGALRYLTKPIHPTELINHVNEALGLSAPPGSGPHPQPLPQEQGRGD